LVSKVTLRQAARLLGVHLDTVAHRLALLSRHCREFHEGRMRALSRMGGLEGTYLLDELETFETCRLLKPVTVPVLIERASWFVVHAEVAPLPPRSPLPLHLQRRLVDVEATEGKRRSGSNRAVRRTFQALRRLTTAESKVLLCTDRKSSYRSLARRVLGGRATHRRTSSKLRRDRRNPLFRINVTLAMLRDGVSRLVRRNWGHAKLRSRLEGHLWVWIAYRNYVRGMVNRRPGTTPAMALGVEEKAWSAADLLRWRVS
jgi:hypothetical protein